MATFDPDDPDYFYPHAQIPGFGYTPIRDAEGRSWRLSDSRAADSTSFRLWGWWSGTHWVFRTLAQINSSIGLSAKDAKAGERAETQMWREDTASIN